MSWKTLEEVLIELREKRVNPDRLDVFVLDDEINELEEG